MRDAIGVVIFGRIIKTRNPAYAQPVKITGGMCQEREISHGKTGRNSKRMERPVL